jgi:hypothetical protein
MPKVEKFYDYFLLKPSDAIINTNWSTELINTFCETLKSTTKISRKASFIILEM